LNRFEGHPARDPLVRRMRLLGGSRVAFAKPLFAAPASLVLERRSGVSHRRFRPVRVQPSVAALFDVVFAPVSVRDAYGIRVVDSGVRAQ